MAFVSFTKLFSLNKKKINTLECWKILCYHMVWQIKKYYTIFTKSVNTTLKVSKAKFNLYSWGF